MAGIWIAWRAESATTLLVVAAIFVIVALSVGHDWDRIEAAYGPGRVLLQRYQREVANVVVTSETTDEVRERLEKVDLQVATALDQLERLRERPRQRASIPRASEAYSSLGEHSARLTLTRPQGSPLNRTLCKVIDPDGHWKTITARRASAALLPQPINVMYPDDFEGAPDLRPGTYFVEWMTAPIIGNLFTPPEVIATDSFTVRPKGGNGWKRDLPRTVETTVWLPSQKAPR